MKIDVHDASGPRKDNVNQVEFTDENGFETLVDEDCTNNEIDVKECVAKKNRYYPCPPPEFKLADDYNNLFEERSKQFITILESHGYKINGKIELYEGATPFWEYENSDDRYDDHVAKFLSEIDEAADKKLPQVYENFQRDFGDVRKKIRDELFDKFSHFEHSLNSAGCRKEITEPSSLIKSFKTEVDEIQQLLENAKNSLQISENSIKTFYEEFPTTSYDRCDQREKIHHEVDQKIQFLKRMQWYCFV